MEKNFILRIEDLHRDKTNPRYIFRTYTLLDGKWRVSKVEVMRYIVVPDSLFEKMLAQVRAFRTKHT